MRTESNIIADLSAHTVQHAYLSITCVWSYRQEIEMFMMSSRESIIHINDRIYSRHGHNDLCWDLVHGQEYSDEWVTEVKFIVIENKILSIAKSI